VGLRFADDKQPVLSEVLASRLAATRCSNAATYLARLSGTDAAFELGELARAITVAETYFFRNPDQLRAFEALLRQREREGERHVRVLSAGCASGEEPYSLAITIRETLPTAPDRTVSIRAVDLSPDAIARARAGVYPRWSFRATSEAHIRTYFCARGSSYELADEIRRTVTFAQDNLVQPMARDWEPESFDFVFCRNVIMYFTPEAQRSVVARLARALAPGGRLFLGHAETLRGLSRDFRLCSSHDTFFYEKRSVGVERPTPPPPRASRVTDPTWIREIGEATSRVARLAAATPAPPAAPLAGRQGDTIAHVVSLMREERWAEALSLLPARENETGEPEARLLRAILSTITGDVESGEALCDELLGADDCDAAAHYVKALCREHAGDQAAAIEHSRAAAYLDAGFAMPHLQLGRLARRAGDLATARRELAVALGLLSEEDSTRIVLFGGGFARDALRELCRGELSACGSGS
jgi:chemotaxis protein methyltransferase CheR